MELEGELALWERFIHAPNNESQPFSKPGCIGDGQLKLLAGLTCRGMGQNPFCPLPIGLGYPI